MSEEDTPLAQKIDDDTCRYTETRYADGTFMNNGIFGVDDSQGAYAASNDVASGITFFPSTSRSSAQADAGVAVIMPNNLPEPSTVTVFYPWHTDGQLEADSEINPIFGSSTGRSSYTLELVIGQGAIQGSALVVDEAINAVGGFPASMTVSRDWDDGANASELGIDIAAGQTYQAFIRSRTETEATSVPGANGRALADFFMAGHAFTDYQDWNFQLPPGWIITSCA